MIRFILPVFAFALLASVPALATEVLSVPNFKSVELEGGGDVVFVPGPSERVTILKGASAFTRVSVNSQGTLKIDACNANCPHHYDLKIEVQSPRVLPLAVDGGGAISIAPGFGREHQIEASVNGGGRIDTRALEAGEVTAAVNGGGELLVRASSRLVGAVRGGGVVRYWGNPEVTSAIQGGGAIRPGY